MAKWQQRQLGDCLTLRSGGTPSKARNDYWGGDIPWVSCKDMKVGRIHDAEDHLTPLGAENGTRLVPENTILFVVRGMILARDFPIAMTKRTVAFNQDLKAAEPADFIDNEFLFQWFRANTYEILGRADEAGHGTKRIQTDRLLAMPISVPPLPVQRRIAGILSAYDELMENSQRRIRLLEAMARALYRECIREDGDSTSVKGILETDYWTFISANVSPYGGTKRYYATADIEGLAVQGAGIDYTFAEKPSRAQKQPTPFSLWFARMKDTYKIAWYSEVNAQSADSTILSSGFAGFQAVEPLYFPLLFLTVSSKEFHAQKDLYCTGATQMSLTNEGLSIIEVPAPTKRAARRLGERTLPLLNQILVLQLRIQNLRRTRDLLLPRLLSGQVSLAVNGT